MPSLKESVRKLIAEDAGVEPEDVNAEFVRQHREKVYRRADHKFVSNARTGGHNSHGLRLMTFPETEAERVQGEAILESFQRDRKRRPGR